MSSAAAEVATVQPTVSVSPSVSSAATPQLPTTSQLGQYITSVATCFSMSNVFAGILFKMYKNDKNGSEYGFVCLDPGSKKLGS